MISIDKTVLERLKEAPTLSEYKIFLYIALNQPDEGNFGFQTSKIQLQIDLNLKRAQIFRSIKWLKDELLIHELKLGDESDFMANPRWVMNNSEFQPRMDEWSRRQRLDIQRELRLKKERRARQLRNEKKQ